MVAIDNGRDGIGWGEYLWVKVMVDLAKPLMRGRMTKVKGNSMWIAFQYEHFSKFYFHCGVIDHGQGGCQKKMNYETKR